MDLVRELLDLCRICPVPWIRESLLGRCPMKGLEMFRNLGKRIRMGRSATQDFDRKVKEITMGVNGVLGVNDLRSHYVGNKFHIEIHIEVDKDHSTSVSHRIGTDVKFALEKMEEVQKAFVHVDPV